MTSPVPDVIRRYFEADARRDVDGVVRLFTDNAEVVDEGESWRGASRIRAWREGPASRYEYTTELFDTKRVGTDKVVATGRLEGNFPGGTADLTWCFTIGGDLITRLHIGP
jgi:hypothetical protein